MSAKFRTAFYRNELDSVFKSGYALYHAGLVQGVLVADPVRFYGLHHRANLVCWLPFNEHNEDALSIDDKSAIGALQVVQGVAPLDRQFDLRFGWNLHFKPGAKIFSNSFRELSSAVTASFWIKPDLILGGGSQSTILEIGPLSIDLSDTAQFLIIYVRDVTNTRQQAATIQISPTDFNFVALRWTPLQIQYGLGSLTGATSKVTVAVSGRAFSGTDTLLALASGSRGFAIRDLRIWNSLKTDSEIDLIRYHRPVSTAVNYRPAVVNILNSPEQYGMKVLDCGWITFAPLPAWYRTPKLAEVRRYDSLGRYSGESRFKETGLGGGITPPASYQLGSQFQNLTGLGSTVVSTRHGALPGINAVWSSDTSAGTYRSQILGIGTMVPYGAIWKYLDNGSDQGTAWRSTGFNDGSWASGPGQLGYGEGDEATVLSYGANSNLKYITYYFRGSFFVDNPGSAQNVRMDVVYDDGAVFYMNGTEFYRANMPAGSISYVTLAGSFVENQFESVRFNKNILKPGANVVAVEVHQQAITSTDLSFDMLMVDSGSTLFPLTGTVFPWPNSRAAFNPNVDRIWSKGDDNFVYEITLESTGSTSATCLANKLTMFHVEQPTGAVTEIADSGTVLSVTAQGTVYQKPFSGTYTRPPAFLYLNSVLKERVSGAVAISRWVNPNDFGLMQGVPALPGNGDITFSNNGTLLPGNYRLKIDSGNLGRVDDDFDGFSVDITVADTVLSKRLLPDGSGSDFRGVDQFEFTLQNAIKGDWLLNFRWRNELNDMARGTARQFAVYGYELQHLTTSLFKLSIAGSGTTPLLTPLYTDGFTGSTPGGWVASYNSFGTVKSWAHESKIYPRNDTITVKQPKSDLLTSSTAERREDILIVNNGSGYFVLPDDADPVFTAFGTGILVL